LHFQTGWSIPVELIIGPDVGISYTAQAASQLILVADFSHVSQVETLLAPTSSTMETENLHHQPHRHSNKAVIQIKVAGASEPLLITCASIDMAESIADLIDRYCRLVNGTHLSLWNKRGSLFIYFLVVYFTNMPTNLPFALTIPSYSIEILWVPVI
jgi:focal adhesion kinase 1